MVGLANNDKPEETKMNKNEITKTQGKAIYAAGGNHTHRAALVLNLTSLYTERRTWGKATRFFKTPKTACKQDRLGCVETGWLVLTVSSLGYTPDIKERIAKAEAFVKSFVGSADDLLDEEGYVRRDLLPADVNVVLVNNRNLAERPVETTPDPVQTVVAEGVSLAEAVEDACVVVKVTVADGVTYPWLRADNAAKAWAKENSDHKLVRVHSQDNKVFTYKWDVDL